MSKAAPKVLHCLASFDPGGKERRTVQLINAFGPALQHTIVSAQPDAYGAASLIRRGIKVSYPKDRFPSMTGKPLPGRMQQLAQAMEQFDLILTYNWGAMDVAMAHTLFAERMGLPALIHHEDGFNEDEATRRKLRRNWYRRIALGRSAGIAVPSQVLARIARQEWQQPPMRVHRIPNGIDIAAFAKPPEAGALRRLIKRPGELWVGTLAGLRPVKQLPMLVQAFAALPSEWHLVIAGEGPEGEAIRAAASTAGVVDRVHLVGQVDDPSRIVGLFDIFALSSASEQFPISVVEAMAAGLPVAAPTVGDVAAMVADENTPFIVAPGDIAGLSDALLRLSRDGDLRREVGAANRARAAEQFDETIMIQSYRSLYGSFLPAGTLR